MAGPLFELEQEYGSIFGGMMKRKVKGKSPKNEESKSVRSGLINGKIVDYIVICAYNTSSQVHQNVF